MKFQLTVTVEPRTPEGWDTPADAEDTLSRITSEIIGSGDDYDGNGVAFLITDVEAKVLEP